MVEKLHILHVVGAMEIGGIENMLMTLMPYMKDKGVIFDFVVHGKHIGIHEAKVKELGGSVYHLPKFIGVNMISYIIAWCKLLFAHPELKIIHGHMTSTASLYLGVAKCYGRVTIAHSHSTSTSGGLVVRGIKRLLEYPLRYLSDYLCSCSVDAADYRFGKGIYKQNNYFLWHNPIEIKKFKFSKEKRRTYREKIGVSKHTIVIGHVGRMVAAKNHRFLVDIFAAYKQLNSDSKLLLLGSGELQNEIKKYVVDRGMSDDVIFTGGVLNTADYLSAMDVFCFPSLYEGLSISLIEAQTNGLLCIASDRIPVECKFSDDIFFLPLEMSALEWGEFISNRMKVKNNRYSDIKNPYDVSVVINEIYRFYAGIVG